MKGEGGRFVCVFLIPPFVPIYSERRRKRRRKDKKGKRMPHSSEQKEGPIGKFHKVKISSGSTKICQKRSICSRQCAKFLELMVYQFEDSARNLPQDEERSTEEGDTPGLFPLLRSPLLFLLPLLKTPPPFHESRGPERREERPLPFFPFPGAEWRTS